MKRPQRKRAPVGGWRRAVLVWLSQHAQALVYSIGQWTRSPLSSFMTSAVIGISLALPASFYLVLENTGQALGGWGGVVEMSLFLDYRLAEDEVDALAATLRANPAVDTVRVISPAQALAEYQQSAALGDAFAALEENPLPAVLVVRPRPAAIAGDNGSALLAQLNTLPEVDSARFDQRWVQRLAAIIDVLHRAALVLAVLLAVAVLLIVGYTIRMAIYNRRSEIEINKLFGATDAYIQRPFLYTGLVHGVLGSLMAWLLLDVGVWFLGGPTARLAQLYGTDFAVIGLGLRPVAVLLAAGAALGWIGAWLAVQRHLKDIEPA